MQTLAGVLRVCVGFLLAIVGTVASQPILECEDAPDCARWVATEDTSNCSAYPGLLRVRCPLVCGSCGDHAAFRSCAQAATGADRLVASPADISELLDGVASRAQATFGPNATVLHQDPLVLQLDGFLTPEDAATLVQLAEDTDFQRGDRYIDGAAELRTSSTTFCEGACPWALPGAAFAEQISRVLRIPSQHFEPIQFVKYEEGQRYALHSDYVDGDAASAAGPRLLTFFVYLSAGFEGGETAFPQLGLKVEPHVGRAVLWGNAFAFVGGKTGKLRWFSQSKTEHEALAVGAVHSTPKYAANIWVHDGAFRLARHYEARCKRASDPNAPALEL